MFRKEDVRFPAEGGIELSAWLFLPEQRAAPLRTDLQVLHDKIRIAFEA